MDIELFAFLKDGKYRIRTLKILNTKSMISSEIARELNINRASMSRILKRLESKKLIFSTSSNSRTVVYSISKKGQNILNELK